MKECEYINCQQPAKVKYCSLSCGAKQQQLNASSLRVPKTRLCKREECGNIFVLTKGTYENVYCSHSCAAIVNNTRRTPPRYCIECLKKLSPGKPNMTKYCSKACYADSRRNYKINLWLVGEWDGCSSQGLAVCIKKYLIKQANYRCQSPDCAVPGGFCSINKSTGKCPLEVDHIDGNAFNNAKENLIVICPNCHALTPTFRALNKNSTRKYRRKQI